MHNYYRVGVRAKAADPQDCTTRVGAGYTQSLGGLDFHSDCPTYQKQVLRWASQWKILMLNLCFYCITSAEENFQPSL